MTSPSLPAAEAPAESTAAPPAAPAEEIKNEPLPGWTAADRWFFAVVGAVLFITVSVHALRLSGWGLTPIPIERPEDQRTRFQLDVNTATWVEWMQLEGIGESLARQIVADRDQTGPFQSVDDLSRVKGIGPARLSALRPWLRYDERTARPTATTESIPFDTPD